MYHSALQLNLSFFSEVSFSNHSAFIHSFIQIDIADDVLALFLALTFGQFNCNPDLNYKLTCSGVSAIFWEFRRHCILTLHYM